MGNTCASLHIAWRRNIDDVAKAISRSYGKLGYERAKKAPPEGGKHVILRATPGQAFVSIYDSDNARLDDGGLKDLALAASKILKTAAVFTSLDDSDRYEFIVFSRGRQVDLLMTDAESYAGPMKRLTGKSRTTQWNALFTRTLNAGQIAQASAQTIFADSAIGGLSELIGLPRNRPLTNYQDFLDGGEEITAQLYFTRKPVEVSSLPAGEIRLANAYDSDDTRALLVYPAAWPMAVGKPTNLRWMLLSQGAGFYGGSATIRVSGPDGGPVLSKGAMRGFKFHNGQIVGDLETRPTDKDHVTDYYAFPITPIASASPGSQSYTADFPNLDVPPMTPGRTTQILILLVLFDLQSQTAGEWEINVSLRPGAPSDYRYNLPPARIAAVGQTWLPVVSGLNPTTIYDKSGFSTDPRIEQDYLRELADKQSRTLDDRLLIHPAISSNVAILPDAGQPTLDTCKTWLEAWLSPLQQRKGEIRIYTEKKLSPGIFKPAKSKKSLPAPALLPDKTRDKTWEKLFDYANNYQSVLIDFVPENEERAIAGIGLQYSHARHFFQGYEAPIAKTLTAMRGRSFPEEPYGSTLHAFQWVTHHPDCYAQLNTSPGDMGQRLDSWVAENSVLQAWHGQSTWVPLFDQASHIGLTVYERSSALNWFRGVVPSDGLYRKLMSVQWCGNVLRMVTTHMWLCRTLMDQVDRAALEHVAQVTETNGVFKIMLNPGRAMDELELALLPILPVESARISVP